MKIAVIADDLTGALDTGVQFRTFGMTVEVAPKLEKLGNIEKDSDVVVVNTDSRYLEPGKAYSRVREATLELAEAMVWYKKIDSTLRGNIGAELDAMLEYSDQPYSMVAPAFPQARRITVKGIHTVDGVPLHETEYAAEIACQDSFIPNIIKRQTERKVTQITLEEIRKGPRHLNEKLAEETRKGAEIIVLDSEYERDLRCIAEACKDTRVVSGSAGLASELPEGLGLINPRPTLTVCGSMRTTTRNQLELLERHLGLTRVTLDEDWGKGKLDSVIGILNEALELNKDVAVMSPEKPVNLKHGSGEDWIVKTLADITAELLARHDLSGVIMAGGATSLGICEKLGVDSMEILGEVRPGIPLLRLSNDVIAVTKAGGFGDEYTLIEAVRYLRRMKK